MPALQLLLTLVPSISNVMVIIIIEILMFSTHIIDNDSHHDYYDQYYIHIYI